jgi:type I restriction-modification system DNA methylase subunit
VRIKRKTPKGVFLFHIISIYYKKHIMKKIINLTEGDLKKIISRVISEQVLSDYNEIVDSIKQNKRFEEVISNQNITRYKFNGYGGGKIGFIDIKTKMGTPEITVYTIDSKGNKGDVSTVKTVQDLQNIMSPYN